MSVLAIDIETYSEVDLPKCGVYAYTDHPSFEILLFAYAFDDEQTQIVDLKKGETLPQHVLQALMSPEITKVAFNAAFERTCISKHLGVHLSPVAWHCTAVQSAMLALPLSLDGVGEVLNIERKKFKEGSDLVRFFSLPCKPTASNGYRSRNLPQHAPDKWERFKAYCIRDVDAEREIRQKLHHYPIPATELELYCLDQEINDRGIMVDPVLVKHAIECDQQYKDYTTQRAYELTGLENPNSPSQIRDWLAAQGVETETLDKKAVKALLPEAGGDVLEVLKLHAEENPQLMIYGLGVLHMAESLYDIETVRMTIFQPRLYNVSSWEVEPEYLKRWGEEVLRPAGAQAMIGAGEFAAGSWCRFCRARNQCRARAEHFLDMAKLDFKQPALLSDEEIADIISKADGFVLWVKEKAGIMLDTIVQALLRPCWWLSPRGSVSNGISCGSCRL